MKGRTVGEILADLRATAGLSQSQLADKANMPIRTLQNIEQGTVRDPALSTCIQLVEALGVSLDVFRQADVSNGKGRHKDG